MLTARNSEPMSYAKPVMAAHEGELLTDLDIDEIKGLFKQHGALLFRGFSAGLDQLVEFSDKFCFRYITNPDAARFPISKEEKVKTVNVGMNEFHLHAESSGNPFGPDICWFYCHKAPASAGETTYCDGELLASLLSPRITELFCTRMLNYKWAEMPLERLKELLGTESIYLIHKILEQRNLTRHFRVKGTIVETDYTTPAFTRTRFGDRPAFVNFLLFSRFTRGQYACPTFDNGEIIPDSVCQEIKDLADQITVHHQWQDQDLLMLDNSRFMHGRDAVHPFLKREIWTRFGFVKA